MSMVRLGRVANVWLAGLFLFTTPIQAQEASATAERLFEQGRSELYRGDYEAACMHLRESNELDPAPGTELNLGECEVSRGRLVTAWGLFSRVERELPANDIRLPIARQKREALELRLGRLSIHFTATRAKETRVRVQSRRFELHELRDAILVEPGNVEVTVLEPGKPERLYVVTIVAGKSAVLDIGTPPSSSVDAAPTRTSSVVSAPPPRAVGAGRVSTTVAQPLAPRVAVGVPISRVLPRSTPGLQGSPGGYGYVLLGGGVVVAALGGILGLLTLDAKRTNVEHCDEALHTCDATGRSAARRGRIFGVLTTTAWVAGGVGIALGTYSLVTTPRRSGSTLFIRVGAQRAEITAQYSY